jgi:phosphotransferase system enzyme I (PtsI)
MFPFVSGIEQLRAARAAVLRAEEALRSQDQAYGRIEIGVMIEVPSAAITADLN